MQTIIHVVNCVLFGSVDYLLDIISLIFFYIKNIQLLHRLIHDSFMIQVVRYDNLIGS